MVELDAKYKRRSDAVRHHTELLGRVFGRLTVVGWAGRSKATVHYSHCDCVCGGASITPYASLLNGHTTSCGCAHRDAVSKHGMDGTRTYKSWLSMRARCSRVKNHNYPLYGGRGIKVCARWQDSFENFLEDLGGRPENKTLDRVDSEGDYEPNNCRWASTAEQNQNRRDNVLNPEKVRYIRSMRGIKTQKVLAKEMGCNSSTISLVLSRGLWNSVN